MKKLLKFLLYFILFVLVILFTAPIIFKGKIMKIANEQINNNINAKANIEDVRLSFFKNFPYLNAGIKNMSVTGIDNFEGDTLLYVESVDVAVNVISAIKMDNIEVKKIAVVNPTIHAIVLTSGEANWDIAKPTEEETPVETDTTPSEFNASVGLKLFEIKQANITYTDYSSDMNASLTDFNFELTGDLSKDFSKLVINSQTEKLNFGMSGVNYLKDVLLNIHIDVDANLADMIFILNENSFALNELALKLDGSVEMPESGDMAIDMKYATSNTDFKTLLSLVPAIYMRDFTDIKTEGKLALDGTIKGLVKDDITPDVKGTLKVSNASFSYPDLPKSAKNINIDVAYFYDGKQMDNTTLDVNKFHAELGGSPVDLTLNLKTPISDPFVNAQLNTNLNLSNFADLIPLEDTRIEGLIVANLDLMGNMSTIENEQYEDFKAVGNVSISDFLYSSPDLPKQFSISNADIGFSPKYVELKSFAAQMGRSDFSLSGKVTDFLPFVFNDQTVHGTLAFNSNLIDLNEFMSASETEDDTESSDTSALSVIPVPDNIDFTLNSAIGSLNYDKLQMNDVKGNIYIRDSRVVLEELSMNTMDGSFVVSGEYNTQDIDNPLVDFGIQAKSIDIAKAFSSFDILGKIAPIASKAVGDISFGLDFTSFLKQDMKPILNSIVGGGNLKSEKIGITGSSAFNAINKNLNSDAFRDLTLSDIDLDFLISEGLLTVKPFETNMGKTKLNIGGTQGLDNTMDYGINISAPKSLFGSSNATISNLYSSKAIEGFDLNKSETVNLLVKLTGAIADPKVSIDAMASLKESTQAFTESVKENAAQAIETKKEEAKEKAREEADKLIREAENQAAEIRRQAKIAADKVRSEADANADKLVKEARNPLAKTAAEVAAKKLREEGEKSAQKIESEADSKAQSVVDAARKKADDLLK